MKKIVLLFVFVFSVLCVVQGQQLVDPEKDFDYSVWFVKGDIHNNQGKKIGQQGLEMWDDYIFSLMDKGYCNVYSFSNRVCSICICIIYPITIRNIIRV